MGHSQWAEAPPNEGFWPGVAFAPPHGFDGPAQYGMLPMVMPGQLPIMDFGVASMMPVQLMQMPMAPFSTDNMFPMQLPMMLPHVPMPQMAPIPQMAPMMAQPMARCLPPMPPPPPPQFDVPAMVAPVVLPLQPPSHPLPRGELLDVSKDAKGSRWLQGMLPHLTRLQLEEVADELRPELLELTWHPFGNYLVSRLCVLDSLQADLCSALRGHVVELMIHPQGSRVMQAVIKALPDHAAAELMSELRGHVAHASSNTHGSWSVCVAFERTLAPFVLEEVTAQLGTLALLPHAGRVVQAVIAASAKARLDLRPVTARVLQSDIFKLAKHPFANYTVQLTLKYSEPSQRRRLLRMLLPKLLDLAACKHGSATAEALLQQADAPMLRETASLALAPADGGPSGLQRLCDSSYGNYVLQTLIRLSTPRLRAELIDSVRLASTERNFARIVLSRLGEPDV